MNKLLQNFFGTSPTETHLIQLPNFKSCSHIVCYPLEEIFILVSEGFTGLQYADQYFRRTTMDIIFKNELNTQALADGFEHKIQDTQYLFWEKNNTVFWRKTKINTAKNKMYI